MEIKIYEKLNEIIKSSEIKREEPMSKHTTFRVGGPAEVYIDAKSSQDISNTLKVCKEYNIPYYVIGNGSNLLVGDKGVRGVILQICKKRNAIVVDQETMKIESGALLSRIASEALGHGLAGFEFAAGIPGTLGGAVVMNAGAYGGEMKDILTSVEVVTDTGEVISIEAKDLELGYRTSIIAKKGYVVLSATLALKKGDKEEIKKRMDELKDKRVTKQPLEYPSAGSTFKRPEGYFAGQLIDEAGLRGFQLGGAQVSEKHCGFVINKDNATAKDIVDLMNKVAQVVQEKHGVLLEPEVKKIGDF